MTKTVIELTLTLNLWKHSTRIQCWPHFYRSITMYYFALDYILQGGCIFCSLFFEVMSTLLLQLFFKNILLFIRLYNLLKYHQDQELRVGDIIARLQKCNALPLCVAPLEVNIDVQCLPRLHIKTKSAQDDTQHVAWK